MLMINYITEMELYFELKGTPESSKESYLRRLKAFAEFVQTKNKSIENVAQRDIQEYILYLRSRGTVLKDPGGRFLRLHLN